MTIQVFQNYMPGYKKTEHAIYTAKGGVKSRANRKYNANPEVFHYCIVTGGETWHHNLDPDI